jgi:hypothetical protein
MIFQREHRDRGQAHAAPGDSARALNEAHAESPPMPGPAELRLQYASRRDQILQDFTHQEWVRAWLQAGHAQGRAQGSSLAWT